MTNAVIYARYSSSSQRDASIDQQVAACRKYAEQMEYKVIGVYADHAMTGTNDKRPEFQRMLRDSSKRAFSFVIVYSLDRFSRDRYDSAVHKHELKLNGVRVISAMERITDDPTGILMESILEGFAEYYSKELSQKIRRGTRDSAEKGRVLGKIPFGYRRGEDGRFAIDPDNAPVVEEIYRRTAACEQAASIIRDINRRGIRTASGSEWTRTSLDTLLTNPRYYGLYKYADVEIEGGMPVVVSRELWEEVQKHIATKPNPRHGPRRNDKGVYLLTGKLFCGCCGAPMVGVSGTGRNGLHHYYKCAEKVKRAAACHKHSVRREVAEYLIAERIRAVVMRDDVIEWLADSAMAYYEQSQQSSDASLLRGRLAATQKKKANLMQAIMAGIVTPTTKDALEHLEDEEASIQADLATAELRQGVPPDRAELTAFLRSFRDGDVSNPTFQAALFDAFLVKAYLYDDHFKIYFRVEDETIDQDVPIDTAPTLPDGIIDLGTVRIDAQKLHSQPTMRTTLKRSRDGIVIEVQLLA